MRNVKFINIYIIQNNEQQMQIDFTADINFRNNKLTGMEQVTPHPVFKTKLYSVVFHHKEHVLTLFDYMPHKGWTFMNTDTFSTVFWLAITLYELDADRIGLTEFPADLIGQDCISC